MSELKVLLLDVLILLIIIMRHQNWFGGFFSRGFTQILSFWFEIFSAKLDGKNFVASCNFGPSGTSQNIDLIDLWHDLYENVGHITVSRRRCCLFFAPGTSTLTSRISISNRHQFINGSKLYAGCAVSAATASDYF